ncbi:hypothetical protein IQ246_24870 [aff. Roholtiella sp. LEGE 12411]|nr:hypothetical protein [aff. Roholtiella sp. LEGE 12411]
MPSISLDGFSTLKPDENFYLWLALRLANKARWVEGEWRSGGGRITTAHAPCPMPNAQCPMPHAQCPMPLIFLVRQHKTSATI